MEIQTFLTIIFIKLVIIECQDSQFYTKLSDAEIIQHPGLLNEIEFKSKLMCLSECRKNSLCCYVSIRNSKCRLYDASALVFFSKSGRDTIYKSNNFNTSLKLNQKQPEYITLSNHTTSVRNVLYLQNGFLASSTVTILNIWDMKSLSVLKSFSFGWWSINALAILPNSELACSLNNKSVVVLSMNDWSFKRMLETPSNVQMISLPNGDLVLGQSTLENNSIIVMNSTDGSIKTQLFAHENSISNLAYSPKGYLASSSWDSTISIWNLTDSTQIEVLTNHTLNVYVLTVLPNGDLVSAGYDKFIFVWNSNDWSIRLTLEPGSIAYSLNVLSNGDILSGQENSSIVIWDSETGVVKNVLNGQFTWVRSFSVFNENFFASCASGDRAVKLWFNF